MLKRAATYIQVRRDAKTRRGKLKCKPPNRRCGGRCIPPTWDCRLNNEGNDPHLTAAGKGVDVTAGVADLQRGVKKLKKGVVTLSPDDIESGRRSISRGVKKLAPGDLQRKQEVQKKVYKTIGMVAAPLTVGILAFAMHRALKGVDSQTGGNFPYRRVMGDRIDNAAVSAVSSLRRNIPLGFGDRFIANDMLARRNIRNTGYGVGQVAGVPDATLANTANTGYLGRQTDAEVAANITRAQRSISGLESMPFDEWQRQSRDTFWRTPRQGGHTVSDTDNASGSVFSPKAANNLLRDSFRLDIATDLKPKQEELAVIAGVRTHLEQTTRTVRAAMSQATLNSRDPNDVELYLGRNPLSLSGNADVDARSRALIVDLVTSRDPQTASRHANHLYRQTVNGFDQYFSAVAERAPTPPGPNREAQARSFFVDANRAHSAFLGRISKVRITPTGPGTEAVTNKISHAKLALNQRKPRIELTDPEIVNALSELGRTVPSTREAQLSSLNEVYAHSGARFNRVPPETRQYGKAPPASGGARERPGKRRVRSAAQIVQDLIKAGWGVEAAQAEAAKIVRSRKTDSVDREDKKCGKSGIPEGRKCTKKTLAATGTSSGTAEKPKPTTTASPEPVAQPNNRAKILKIAAISAAVALSVGTASLAKKYSPELLRTGISGLSSGAVNSAIKGLPKRFQEPASRLQGNAKLSLAVMSLKADKMEMVGVNQKSNFSTWKSPKGGFVSVGSVGDSLLAFYTEPSRSGSSRVAGFNVSFKVDQHYKQKEGVDRKQSIKIARTIETMFNDHVERLPPNALLTAAAFTQDGNGQKRTNIYTRKGFTLLLAGKEGKQDILGLFKVKGKLVKPPENEQERQAMWQKIHSEARP
jgi:hypothetical protein